MGEDQIIEEIMVENFPILKTISPFMDPGILINPKQKKKMTETY